MNATLDLVTTQELPEAEKLVIPVRFVAGGAVVQTTSTAFQPGAIHVRAAQPPQSGRVVGLQLQFPEPRTAISVLSIVAERTFGANPGFWAEFAGNDGGAERVAALLERYQGPERRTCTRHRTQLPAVLRSRRGPPCEAVVSNLSQTGAFLRMPALLDKGSIVELDITFPDDPLADTTLGFVVHVAPRVGIGVQFVGASDEFRSRLDRCLANFAR